MGNEDNLLRLLIAEESYNDAEMLVSVLRNAGYAVRPTRVEDDEDLENALDQKAQDLFICAAALSSLPLETALRTLERSGKDVPLVVLSDAEDPALRDEVLRLGAADAVSKGDTEHFRLVVLRESRHLRERRRLRRLEAALRETERRCSALLDSSRDAIAYVHEGMHIYANKAYLEHFGIDESEGIEGLPLLDMVAPADQARAKEFFRRYAKGNQDVDHIELRMQGPEEPEEMRLELSPASIEGEACTQVLIRRRATEAVPAEDEMERLSQRDLLTGLFNRRHFLAELDREVTAYLERDDGRVSGLLYVQLDNLEAVQDSLGITALDQVITDTGAEILESVSSGDVPARYSDHAFTVLLPNRGVHESVGVAEALRKRVEDHVSEAGNRTVTKTCSVGVAMLGDMTGSAQGAINLAYEACEMARREGGNRVHLYAPQEDTEAGLDWKNRLNAALTDDDLVLVYQPIVSLGGDTRIRYEVRVRLRGENGELLRPEAFMPAAEQFGLMPAIDRWVVERCIRRLAGARPGSQAGCLFVKVAGATLGDSGFASFLTEALATHKVDGSCLAFELNEPVAITQLNQAKNFYDAVRAQGCSFVLDHFGSGLNSFQLLKHLPADCLKLDHTLIDDITTDEGQRTISQITETAHSMDRQVIAGALEEATTLAVLWQCNVDFVQGNFLQEPEAEPSYDFSGMVI